VEKALNKINEGFFMKKHFFMALIVGVVISSFATVSNAEDEASSEILKKLDQVMQSQETIIQSLEEIKSDLQIVKVRASSR